jgi:hypothetical protein
MVFVRQRCRALDVRSDEVTAYRYAPGTGVSHMHARKCVPAYKIAVAIALLQTMGAAHHGMIRTILKIYSKIIVWNHEHSRHVDAYKVTLDRILRSADATDHDSCRQVARYEVASQKAA